MAFNSSVFLFIFSWFFPFHVTSKTWSYLSLQFSFMSGAQVGRSCGSDLSPLRHTRGHLL